MLCFGGENAPHIVIPASGVVAPTPCCYFCGKRYRRTPYCHSEERSDAGISFSIMQRNLARGYVSLRGAERRGNLIQCNARIKPRGNLLLVTHIYEYVK